MEAWSKLNIRRQQVPLRLLGCSFGRGEKQAIKEVEYTRVNFICSTNCHARALIALTWSARDWALLESQAVGESSKVALVGSCSHHTFHLYQRMEGISAVLFFHKVIQCRLFRDQKGNFNQTTRDIQNINKVWSFLSKSEKVRATETNHSLLPLWRTGQWSSPFYPAATFCDCVFFCQ